MTDAFIDETLDLHEFEVFPWHESFDTGHALIDQQHRRLVHLLNKLANTLATDDTIEINQAFSELAAYADAHFADEEKIWDQYFGDDYCFESHQMAHAGFLPKVLELRDNRADAGLPQMIEDVVKFLIRWLAFHIIDNDKRMALVVAAIDEGCSLSDAKEQADKKMGGAMRDLIEAILSMYEGLSSTALDMIRERNARLKAEGRLQEAYRELEAKSITDQLTGLFNRRHLEDVAKREIARAAREDLPLSLFMLDVDHFKKFNDRYGHVAGDEALQMVALALQRACQRPGDFCFRYGGEEFCVIETGTIAEEAAGLGEKILENVRNLQIPHEDNESGRILTVSVGSITWKPKPGDLLERFVEIADRALYQSKASGRNRATSIDHLK